MILTTSVSNLCMYKLFTVAYSKLALSLWWAGNEASSYSEQHFSVCSYSLIHLHLKCYVLWDDVLCPCGLFQLLHPWKFSEGEKNNSQLQTQLNRFSMVYLTIWLKPNKHTVFLGWASSVHNSRKNSYVYIYLAMLSATYNDHSSTRHVHNLRISQLYTCTWLTKNPWYWYYIFMGHRCT